MSERPALGRVRGYGSAKEGVREWWAQRLTSVALVVLSCWFVVSLLSLPAHDHATVTAWIRGAWTAPMLIIFVLVCVWHSQLGMRVILEDYVHEVGWKTLCLAASSFAHVAIAVLSVVAVLRIALGSDG